MGWKAVREHYRIEHLVQVVPGKGICIGSPYVHDIIVISADRGEVVKRAEYFARNGNLARYLAEMDADPFKLAELVAAEDAFERSIPVFTYEGGAIIEKQCEELGWPNVTHDGLMQYDNQFSPDAGLVRTWAIDSARSGIEWMTDDVAEQEKKLAEMRARLAKREADLAALLDGAQA